MKNEESVMIICITVLIILFWGDPDIHDSIISVIETTEKSEKESQE